MVKTLLFSTLSLMALAMLAFSSAMGVPSGSSSSEDQTQPNILFIFADDYGWNDIGYHGSDIQTPVLDKLADEGVKLENYYVHPVCTPSRAAFVSGRYPIHNGLQHFVIRFGNRAGLPLAFPTIAERIRDAGYSTHLIGKWHLGFYKEEFIPTNRGFDTFFGYYNGLQDYYSHDGCSFSMPSVCGFDLHNGTTAGGVHPVTDRAGEYGTTMYADEAVRLIDSRTEGDKPMFMYLALPSPHTPLQVPSRFEEQYDNMGLTPERQTYAGMVTAMDEAIGNVTDALKRAGMKDDTIIIFSADNGGAVDDGASNYPLRGQKLTLWEGGIRAVGFVSGKPVGRKHAISSAFMHVTDWYPTLVNLAGGSLSNTTLDGYDMWPTITNDATSPRQEMLVNINPLWPRFGTNPYNSSFFDVTMRAALRVGDWKIMTGDPGRGIVTGPNPTAADHFGFQFGVNAPQNVWLYNVATDPNETTELQDSHPEKVLEMLRRLKEYENFAVPPNFPPFDPLSDPQLGNGFWEPWVSSP